MVIEHRLVHFAEPFFNDFPTVPCKRIGTALNGKICFLEPMKRIKLQQVIEGNQEVNIPLFLT